MTARDEARRLGARAFGARGEALAAQALEAEGWRILARKFVIRGGEIDLVARRDDTVAFVEVKARPRLAQAAAAISERQRRRLARAAAAWLSQNPWAMDGFALRGDAVLVDAVAKLHHIEDAFALEYEG